MSKEGARCGNCESLLVNRRCPSGCSDGSYAGTYGAGNPWVEWLRQNAPALLKETPRSLRAAMGVRGVDVPGLEELGFEGKRQLS